MTDRDKLMEVLSKYFGINDSDGSYTHELTRCKSAYSVGTMSMEDFEEWTEHNVADLADYVLKRIHFTPSPKALNLDEINQLNGEPVYFLHVDGEGAWFLNGWHLPVASSEQNHGMSTLSLESGTAVDLTNYGKTWFAYTAKPAMNKKDENYE